MSSIVGNIIGGGGNSIPKTYILKTEDGREIPAVLTEEEVDITATANDIRLGKIAVTENGVITGEKNIPSYETRQGVKAVPNGSALTITGLALNDNYDYTKLQTIICAFNTNSADSVAAKMVSIEDSVYNVQSTEALSTITKNHDSKTIELGITNDTGSPLIIRYFTFKEVE